MVEFLGVFFLVLALYILGKAVVGFANLVFVAFKVGCLLVQLALAGVGVLLLLALGLPLLVVALTLPVLLAGLLLLIHWLLG